MPSEPRSSRYQWEGPSWSDGRSGVQNSARGSDSMDPVFDARRPASRRCLGAKRWLWYPPIAWTPPILEPKQRHLCHPLASSEGSVTLHVRGRAATSLPLVSVEMSLLTQSVNALSVASIEAVETSCHFVLNHVSIKPRVSRAK